MIGYRWLRPPYRYPYHPERYWYLIIVGCLLEVSQPQANLVRLRLLTYGNRISAPDRVGAGTAMELAMATQHLRPVWHRQRGCASSPCMPVPIIPCQLPWSRLHGNDECFCHWPAEVQRTHSRWEVNQLRCWSKGTAMAWRGPEKGARELLTACGTQFFGTWVISLESWQICWYKYVRASVVQLQYIGRYWPVTV